MIMDALINKINTSQQLFNNIKISVLEMVERSVPDEQISKKDSNVLFFPLTLQYDFKPITDPYIPSLPSSLISLTNFYW